MRGPPSRLSAHTLEASVSGDCRSPKPGYLLVVTRHLASGSHPPQSANARPRALYAPPSRSEPRLGQKPRLIYARNNVEVKCLDMEISNLKQSRKGAAMISKKSNAFADCAAAQRQLKIVMHEVRTHFIALGAVAWIAATTAPLLFQAARLRTAQVADRGRRSSLKSRGRRP